MTAETLDRILDGKTTQGGKLNQIFARHTDPAKFGSVRRVAKSALFFKWLEFLEEYQGDEFSDLMYCNWSNWKNPWALLLRILDKDATYYDGSFHTHKLKKVIVEYFPCPDNWPNFMFDFGAKEWNNFPVTFSVFYQAVCDVVKTGTPF